ncbi:MAG TPA: zinc-binding alcohol dehydrogenase family protein [Candidatus Sulfotelmatobacter sp.]|jgi:zinc-binding alcohol dehydrogenase family protein|nr:zinc-binding alcohol dehydrogenase family protein [Candidatus Sulfotelmatobacter sp.]
MRVVGYRHSLPIEDANALIDAEAERPSPKGRDLLVSVKAVSVNPVDTKVRKGADPAGALKQLGFDAAGVVVETGPDVGLFQPGDEVFYAGTLDRPGTNAEFHLVDERIVGKKPSSLGFGAAAALPLTAITAWELLFDRLELRRSADEKRSVLIVGAAGGVGSIAIQLVRKLTGATVIATASRPETAEWCRSMGAHHVIDHSGPFPAQLQARGVAAADLVLGLNASDQHAPQIAEVLAPQGRFGLIDDPAALDIKLFKRKSVSIHWEFMFTRPLFGTADMIRQHELLTEVGGLVDQGVLRSTVADSLGVINAANLKKAHALLESGKSRGKLVLEGF